MSAAQERERAIQAAKSDDATALKRARAVSDPWYRAQALAWVARFAPDANVVQIAGEAVKAASAGKDAYQQVAACAWAVRALAERGHTERATRAASRLVGLAADISHPVSRLNALYLLWQAAWPLERMIREQILEQLVAACQIASSWQAGYTLRDAALMLASEDAAEAEHLIAKMPEGVFKRQAQRRLREGVTLKPRRFFW